MSPTPPRTPQRQRPRPSSQSQSQAKPQPQPGRPARPPAAPSSRPLNEAERDELQALLDRVPAPLEALDVSMLDGYLCGLLVQPDRPAPARWLAHVTDVDGRRLPSGFDSRRLEALVLRRHAELDDAIGRRQWFDPWVYELEAVVEEEEEEEEEAEEQGDEDGAAAGGDEAEDAPPPEVDAVYPWVAGFATAMECFPGLMALESAALNEALALVYRHLAPDDLEDADDLLATIDALEPPADLAEAVEGLVRATLLLADIGRPLGAPKPARPRRPGRPMR